jgi:hypothetical protein
MTPEKLTPGRIVAHEDPGQVHLEIHAGVLLGLQQAVV